MTSTALCCSLEVDINGEETFLVDKELLCAYSSKLSKLFGKLRSRSGKAKNLKVIFNDFPGGAKSFELLTRFCYNNGDISLTPFNTFLLHSAAWYMEMDKTVAGAENLLQQTEKSLTEISYWSWNEILAALKQCQDLLNLETSSILLQKCIESLVDRLGSAPRPISCPSSSSSSDTSAVRSSCDTKSTESVKNSLFRSTWWFEDLALLRPEFLQHVVKFMVSQKLDNLIISKFLFFYLKSRIATSASEEKRRAIITVIDSLYLLEWSVISFKSLLGLLRIASNPRVEKSRRRKLETMAGSQMDQATLDSLLIPPPNGAKYLYDVNLVLRLQKAFVFCHHSCPDRLRNVARLMDMYIAEIAPDPSLKLSKFLALAGALPDRARECSDGVYRAMDLYQQVHAGLSDEDRLRVCLALSYDKLSPEACAHLARNTKFKLKSVLRDMDLEDHPANFRSDVVKSNMGNSNKKAVGHRAADNVISDNRRMKEELNGMEWRVLVLEKLCNKMQNQMINGMKSRPGRETSGRYLPMICN